MQSIAAAIAAEWPPSPTGTSLAKQFRVAAGVAAIVAARVLEQFFTPLLRSTEISENTLTYLSQYMSFFHCHNIGIGLGLSCYTWSPSNIIFLLKCNLSNIKLGISCLWGKCMRPALMLQKLQVLGSNLSLTNQLYLQALGLPWHTQ